MHPVPGRDVWVVRGVSHVERPERLERRLSLSEPLDATLQRQEGRHGRHWTCLRSDKPVYVMAA